MSTAKKGRDALRDDNKDLKLKQGFASNDLLISDYERRKRTIFIAKVTDRPYLALALARPCSLQCFFFSRSVVLVCLALHLQDKIRDLQERYRALSAQVRPAYISERATAVSTHHFYVRCTQVVPYDSMGPKGFGGSGSAMVPGGGSQASGKGPAYPPAAPQK